jgi:hypothetical protein
MRHAVCHVHEGKRGPWSDPIDLGFHSLDQLHQFLKREYGKCTGKVRQDRGLFEGVPVGWVFQSNEASQEATTETWVMVLRHSETHGDVPQNLRQLQGSEEGQQEAEGRL